ncbi:MAG TPA: hypothetical protein VMZ53_30335 [Kofleriaceae bacterium]|nr:hypothetical protein [Kofleriaceae bacterium]
MSTGIEVPWSRLLGIAGALLALRTQACEPTRTMPATIATDGNALLVAWEKPTDDGFTIYMRHVPDVQDGTTTLQGGTAIYTKKYGTTGYHGPEVATGPAGSIVIITPRVGEQIAIPVDLDGRVAGPAQPLTGCRSDSSDRTCFWSCRRPIAHAGGFIVGHVSAYPRSSIHSLDLSFLDRAGRTEKFLVLRSQDPVACAMAASGDELVVVSTERETLVDVKIHVLFLALSDGELLNELWIDGGYAFGIVSTSANEYALLHQIPDGRSVLTKFNRKGIESTHLVPEAIDLRTADLGMSFRGLFVSWLANGRAHVLDLTTDREVSRKGVARYSVGTRAVGVRDRCVTAWTSGAGNKVQLLAVPECP